MPQPHKATQFSLEPVKLNVSLLIDRQHAELWQAYVATYGAPVDASNAQLVSSLIKIALTELHAKGKI